MRTLIWIGISLVGAAAWGRRLVRGLFLARRGEEADGEEDFPKYDAVKDARDVWATRIRFVGPCPARQADALDR